MASSSKRKQTMAKVARERALKEKREAKAQKKEERKRAKAEELELSNEPPNAGTGTGLSADGGE
jgi:hypothetical protein